MKNKEGSSRDGPFLWPFFFAALRLRARSNPGIRAAAGIEMVSHEGKKGVEGNLHRGDFRKPRPPKLGPMSLPNLFASSRENENLR
jgi:hypothetical protein